MAFQAPPAGLPLGQAPQGVAQLRTVPELGKLLALGSIANVQVTYDPTNPGELGILFNSKFFPAIIPENVKPGAKLRVSVLENSDAVLLKILDALQEPPKQTVTRPNAALEKLYPNLMRDLNLLFAEESPKELNFVLAPLREEIQKFVAKTIADQNGEGKVKTVSVQSPDQKNLPAASAPSEKGVSIELGKILDKVFARGAILDSSTLAQPEKTFDALLESAKNSLFKNVNEAKEALQRLSGKGLAPNQAQLIKTIETELDKVLAQIPSPELPAPPVPTNTKGIAAPTTAALPGAPQLAPQLTPEVEQTISILFEALKKIKLKPTKEDSATAGELQKLIFQLTTELQTPEIRKSPEAVREVLAKAVRGLKEKFGIDRFTPEESKEIQSGMRALNGLQSLLTAQDTLNQLNPVMDALGEPILILFPMLTAGMLSKMKLSAEHPKVDPEEHKNNNYRSGNDLTKLRFALELPTIGAVEINLAYRKGEIFGAFTFEDEQIADFAKTELPKLTSRFNALGYPSVTLSATRGTPKDITPNWVRDMTLRDGVIA